MNNIDGPSFDMPSIDYRRTSPSFGRRRGPRRGDWNFAPIPWVASPTESKRLDVPMTRVRISFAYQLFGDIDLDIWLMRFDQAKADRWIEASDVLLCQSGSFGLRHLIMFVDAEVPAGDRDDVKYSADLLVSAIIGEPDINLLFVSQV